MYSVILLVYVHNAWFSQTMENNMQKHHIVIAALIGLSSIGFNAHAHGLPQAQHGGVVQAEADLGFELVGDGNLARIFIYDHGTPVNVSQMTGRLTVLQGTTRSQSSLAPAGTNVLQADIQLIPGSRAVATIYRPNQTTITVRFVVK